MNPALDKMTISFYGMDKWAGLSTPHSLQNQISVRGDIPDSLSAWRNGIQFKIDVKRSMNIERYESGNIEVKHQFSVNPRKTQVPFEKYFPHITKLNNFIVLGLGQPTDPRYVNGKVRTRDGKSHDVKIFYKVQGNLTQNVSVRTSRMPFRPPDIANTFPRILNFWYDRSEEIGEIYNLYFDTVYQETIHPENSILSLCHGLESYHRKRFMETYMPPSDYDDVYDDFIELLKGNPSNVYSFLNSSTENLRSKHYIPDPFAQSLADGTLKHANEKSLRRRLKEIITAVQPLIEDLPQSIVGKHEKVADTRNYFAHRTDELKQKAAHGTEQLELVWGLQQLIEACLLLEIGIQPDLIKGRLNNRYEDRLAS